MKIHVNHLMRFSLLFKFLKVQAKSQVPLDSSDDDLAPEAMHTLFKEDCVAQCALILMW
jgi:hypothetical protein